MSFKKIQSRAKSSREIQAGGSAIPGVIPAELLQTVESEISTENAPFLEFLLRHIRKIALAVFLLVASLAGIGVYQWNEDRSHNAALRELGAVLVASPSPEQLQKLMALAEGGPASTRVFAYFEAARLAHDLGDLQTATTAWARVAEAGGALGFTARLGQAQALFAAGDAEAAARIYQEMQTDAETGIRETLMAYAAMAWIQAAEKSESARPEAIRALEALLAQPAVPQQARDFYSFRLARLQSAKAGASQ